METTEKHIRAAKALLEKHDYEILGDAQEISGNPAFAAKDVDGCFVIAMVRAFNPEEGFPEESAEAFRDQFERSMLAFFLGIEDIPETAIRFDTIDIVVVNGDKALVRHITGAHNIP